MEGIIQSRQDMQDRQDRKGKPPDSHVEEFIHCSIKSKDSQLDGIIPGKRTVDCRGWERPTMDRGAHR